VPRDANKEGGLTAYRPPSSTEAALSLKRAVTMMLKLEARTLVVPQITGIAGSDSHGKGQMEAEYDNVSQAELVALLKRRDAEEGQGTRLRYSGQRAPWHIVRKVQPRQQRIDKKLSVGREDIQSRNLILEGENLQGMVSLYRYRGQVDLILTDPPYNTGQDFRYNDRWDEDPNDPDLGELVSVDDGARHAKWLRFMAPRIHMMWEMLKPQGILAICIDHRELFRLGLILDGRFGEDNRLGIINWQKSSPKSDTKHISTVTEYVLVYAKDRGAAATGSVDRTLKAEARFKSRDGDPLIWKRGDLLIRD
jgi:adenine-specific DNA-methyltransferase